MADAIVNDRGQRWIIVHTDKGERVRRYAVPGGWLYQTEIELPANDDYEAWTITVWSPPVFVPCSDLIPIPDGNTHARDPATPKPLY